MDGLLLIDKPEGWTSHDVVAKVRSILRQQAPRHESLDTSQKPLTTHGSQLMSRGSKIRVGHTGTLDPMATGLLVLVVGSYTKRAVEFSKLDKVYEAELTLGATSTTGDREGIIIPHHKNTHATKTSDRLKIVDKTDVENVLKSFIGEIDQTPPSYSAIKVGGKKAYEIARKGGEVKFEPREVTIYEITDVSYEYPTLKFTTKVSSGTYIRSLAEDIGEELGTGAYLTSLRRTEVGQFNIKSAFSIEKLSLERIRQNVNTIA